MASFNSSMSKATVAAMEIGQASAVTIGHRMPLLLSMPFWPQYDALLEVHRMVTEKLAASVESLVAASQETVVLATRTAFGRTSPADMATGMVAIAVAAANPVRRRARANAKRLSSSGSKRG